MPDSITTGLLSDISIREKRAVSTDGKNNELGQDVFLKLMVTQMRNQNPLDPQDNSEFVAQLAQFSSVEGLDKLNNTMNGFVESFQSTSQSSQALQASSLVGRFVKVESDTSYLGTTGLIAGTIELPQSTDNLKVVIYDESDQRVGEELIGEAAAGDMSFSWSGFDANGDRLPSGRYRFEAFANFGGDAVQVTTSLSHNVDSVTVGANGALSLNIAGLGSVPISGVKEIL